MRERISFVWVHDVITSAYVIGTSRTAVLVDTDGGSSVGKTTTSYTTESRAHMLHVMLTPKAKPALV